MQTLLLKVKTVENMQLSDDNFVDQCMHLLMDRYPVITGYAFERLDDEHINVMIWGEDLEIVDD